MEAFFRIKDLQQITGISVSTLRRWIASGVGPPYRKTPTGIYLFKPTEVEAWLNSLEGPRDPSPGEIE